MVVEFIALLSFLFDIFVNILNGTFNLKKNNAVIQYINIEISHSQKNTETNEIYLSLKQAKKIKRRLKYVFMFSKKKERTIYIDAIKLIINIERYLTEEKAVSLIYQWKENGYLVWKGQLDPNSIIIILRRDDLRESIVACEP